MANKYTHDELVGMMKTPGWGIDTGEPDAPVTGTLEELLQLKHKAHSEGEKPGLIRQVATSIELDMLDVEKLWRYLGLPV